MTETTKIPQPTQEEIDKALAEGDVDPRIFTEPVREMVPGKTTPSPELMEAYYREVREAEAARAWAEFRSQFLYIA